MKCYVSAFFILGLVASFPVTAAPEFSLDQLLDAPTSSALATSRDGRQAAWVVNHRGVRNVYLAQAPAWNVRRLTAFENDDGQELGKLGWNREGTQLYFARGGKTGIAEVSNPGALPLPPEREIWRVPTAGGKAARLAAGHSPMVSPAGADVAYVHEGALHVWRAKGAKSERLLKDAGDIDDLRWSPDGRAIAFVSWRRDHSFIGVYWLAERRLAYLDPGVDKDLSPAWSADSRRVAFIRWAYHDELDKPAREGVPFSLRVADAASGEGREIWRAPPGRGAGLSPKIFWGSQLFEGDALLWAAEERLVFPWEGDGRLHLYGVPVAGGAAQLLTPGNYDVSEMSLSGDQHQVLFTANRDDPGRQHLWRVPALGGAAVALTQGRGIEALPRALSANETAVGAAGGSVAYLSSDARTAVHAALTDADGRVRRLDPATADFPAVQLVEPQTVALTAADGQRFEGQLFLPPAQSPIPRGGRPALLFLHGGPPDRILLGYHFWRYYSNTYAFNQYMARRGYVVLSINFRRGSGYGLEFREAERGGLNGASEFADVVAAGRWLGGRSDVDPRRVGLWGGSYGGYLTAMGLARAPELFAAGVDLHGVHDWSTREYDALVPGHDAQGARAAALKLAFESSPLADVSAWRAPVLFVHGDDDLNVKFDQTVRLVDALRKRGLAPEVLVFPNEPHQFLRHASWHKTLHAAAAFFDLHLGGKSADSSNASAAIPVSVPAVPSIHLAPESK